MGQAVMAVAAFAMAASGPGITIFGATFIGLEAGIIAGIGSLALGFVSQALTPKPPKPPGATPLAVTVRENTIMVRQAITARRFAYGWVRVSGPQTFVHSTSNDEKLHIVITTSTHQFSRLDALLLDDEVVPLDANGLATGKYAGKIRAFFGSGTTSGDATFHSSLTTSVTSTFWSSNHLQTNCAKLYVELSFNSDLFPVGVPNISAICRAKNDIVDTRDASTGWTDNAALCINDWLKSSFGYNWPSANIDSTTLNAAANVCDEMVSRNPTFTFTAVAATDVITIGADLPSNTRFRVSNSGGALPAGLSATTTYFYIRVSATTGKVATSKANVEAGTAVDITDTGTGTHTFTRVVEFTVVAATDVVTLTDAKMSMRNGTRFQVAADTTLPTGLSAATNYFWIALTTTTGKVATTLANSRAGTAVDITDTGTGTLTITVNAEPRYTLNGVIDTEQGVDETLGKLLSAMAGLRITQGKTIYLYAGSWRAPTVTITEDDLAGGISVQARRSRRDLFNGVKGVFSNPDDLWQPTDFPPVQVASYVTEDNSVELWRDAELPYTNSPTMAMRISRIDLERARRQITTTWPCKLTALRIAGADVVSLTNTRMGWTAKAFEVARWVFALTGDREAPSLGVTLDVREVDSTVYAWTPSTDESVMQPAPTTNLPDPFTVAAPTGLALNSGTNVLDVRLDGTVFSRILATWTAPASIFVTSGGFIEGETRKSSEADNWRPAFTIRGDLTQAYVLDVEDGINYIVRIRGKTSIGTVSSWTTSSAHTVGGKSDPPANVTSFSAQQNGVTVVFKWSQVADVDLSGYEIRYMQSPFVWNDAIVLTSITKGTQITSAAVPPSPIDPATGSAIPWIFGIKARDTSRNYSVTELTRSLVVVNSFNVIQTIENWPIWNEWETGQTIAYASSEYAFSVSSQTTTELSMFFKPDGTKLFVNATTSNCVLQYSITNSWDLSTASYDGILKSISHIGSPRRGLFFKPDGTKLYNAAGTPSAINQFNIPTAWDVSSLSAEASWSTSSLVDIIGVFFKPDGNKLFCLGGDFNYANSAFAVRQIHVTSAWNLLSSTSLTLISKLINEILPYPVGLSFRRDGRKMYLVDSTSRQILQYNLSEPWDLSTCDYDYKSFVVSSADTLPDDVGFSPDGTQMYVLGRTNHRIHQYRIRSGFHRNPATGNLNTLSQSDASGDDFGVFSAYCINPVSNAVFEAAEVDQDLDVSMRLWGDIGTFLGYGSSGQADAKLDIDHKPSTGSYDNYQTWTVGDIYARYTKARVVSDTSIGPTRLTRFNITLDAEDRIETGSVSITGGATTVVFSENFANLPMVRTWNAEANAKIPGFSAVTNSGFTANLYDATGAVTSGINFWEAKGV